MKRGVSENGFIQINIVVADIEKAAEKWAELLGIEKPEIRVNHLEGGDEYHYRGERVSCDLLCADIPMNGFLIELHQPLNGPSSFREFLDKHGNGVHHIGFEVGDDVVAELAGRVTMCSARTASIPAAAGLSWTARMCWA